MSDIFIFHDIETEYKINNNHKYITALTELPSLNMYFNKTYNKKYGTFKHFIKSKRFKKFKYQFCKRNGIEIELDDRSIILKTSNKKKCNDDSGYYIKASINPYNLTIFELSYIVRLSMILEYLKMNNITTFGYCKCNIKKYTLHNYDNILIHDEVLFIYDDLYEPESIEYTYATSEYFHLAIK